MSCDVMFQFQFQCHVCSVPSPYFVGESVFEEDEKCQAHKNRFAAVAEKQYTQKEAEMTAGLMTAKR